MAGTVSFNEQSSDPSNPQSGYLSLYAKTDGNLYVKNSSGTVDQLNAQNPAGNQYDIQINNGSGSFGTGTPGIVQVIDNDLIINSGGNFNFNGNSINMNTGSTFNFDGTYISVSGNGSYIDLNGFENYIDVSGFENYIALSGYNNYIGLEYGTYISFSDGSQIRDFMNSYGTAGQFLAPTSGSLQWTSVISKQMITTTGNDSISSATALTIYVVLLGTQATEILMFPTAGFDGQVVTINAAAAQTALTLVNGTFANAPTTLVAGQSQSFIWDANTSTWY